jgi:hypothetical protein
MASLRFTLNTEQLKKVAQVLFYTTATNAIATTLTLLPQVQDSVQVDPEWIFLVGLVFSGINTLLVMLKKFIEDKHGKVF